MNRARITVRGVTVVLAAAVAAGLAGCAAQAAPPPAPIATESEPSAAVAIAPPAINKEGILSVCSALGLGAVPLFYFNEDQEPSGIEIEMAKEVALRLGLEYRAESTAFPSLIPSLDAKQCDLVMGSLFITDERKAAVDFVPYLRSGSVLIVTSENPAGIAGFGLELCGIRVGVTTGGQAAVATKELSEECVVEGEPAVVLTELDSAATGRQMLLNGQLDAMAGSSADMYYIAAESEGAIEVAGEPFQDFEIGAAVRLGNTELRHAVADAFDAMVADGAYEAILAEVGLEGLSYFR